MDIQEYFKSFIRVKENFPKQGVSFIDFNALFADPLALELLTKHLASIFPLPSDSLVVAPEARGFVLAPAIAIKVGCGFVPFRKFGKLPDFGRNITSYYGTEYSKDSLTVDLSLLAPYKGKTVLFYDDVLATGGTAIACQELLRKAGIENVFFLFLKEIPELEGRARLTEAGVPNFNIFSLF